MTLRAIVLAAAALPLLLTSPAALAQPADESLRAWLLAARSAVERGRLAPGSDALERAETRLLGGAGDRDGVTPPPVPDIAAARQALRRGDRPAALASIDRALAGADADGLPPVPVARELPNDAAATLPPIAAPAAPPALADAPSPSVPIITRALRAGRWELGGAKHVWVPPDTAPRRVATTHPTAPRWVWDGDEYRLRPQQVPTP